MSDQFVRPDRSAHAARITARTPTSTRRGSSIRSFADQIERANDVLRDYQALLARSRANQLRFNAALLLGALIIVGLAILTALKIADRLVRPVGELVAAAGRIEEGDFSARVPVAKTEDEIQTLATAFNRMTGRLEEQTDALARREHPARHSPRVHRSGAVERHRRRHRARLRAIGSCCVNRSAETLLQTGQEEIEGKALGVVSPELDEFMRGEQSEANVIVVADAGQRTLAVKRVRYQDGSVLTFDDITDQLTDQRRAAWSDIARRIAHEIKNPLTPIQLAAERLQRRFGEEISVGQGDVRAADRDDRPPGRRSAADGRRILQLRAHAQARVPRRERARDRAPGAVPARGRASGDHASRSSRREGEFRMVCDRRQLAQALTNVVKNGVEAIEGRRNRGEHSLAGDRVELKLHEEDGHLVIDVLDTGIGLPEDRERLTEPYMTTRVRGTGLGLAIVKKIVEEHMGEIAFLDRPGGGTHVRIAFDTRQARRARGRREARRRPITKRMRKPDGA